MLELDHLVVTAPVLAEGTAFLEAALGVRTEPGGAHAAMGTHNRLLSLGPGLYLEVIAPDPAAPAPPHPRWFGLDACARPSLSHWVLCTGDLAAAPGDAGRPMALSRGELRWRMAVPETGRLPFDDLHPALIAWDGAAHPAALLPDRGCRLSALRVSHPQAPALAARLVGLAEPRIAFETGAPGLAALIDTPSGRRWL